MSFAQLKKNRTKSTDKLSQQLEKINQKGYSDPMAEKYWKPTLDKAGNGFAIIRFLSEPEGEDCPFVRIFDHSFKAAGGFYIEKSLTTINKDDPVSVYNMKLWNTGTEAAKERVRKMKRRLKYHSNILVIKDPANPENEGKVFLYAYGKKIFDKINDMMHPQFEDEERRNPFDFWEGADFRLKIRTIDNFPNYDKSEFDEPSALFDGDDAKLEEIYGQLNSLQELLDPKNFKTYEELEARFFRAIKEQAPSAGASTEREDPISNSIDDDLNIGKIADSPTESAPSATGDADADEFAFFEKLTKQA